MQFLRTYLCRASLLKMILDAGSYLGDRRMNRPRRRATTISCSPLKFFMRIPGVTLSDKIRDAAFGLRRTVTIITLRCFLLEGSILCLHQSLGFSGGQCLGSSAAEVQNLAVLSRPTACGYAETDMARTTAQTSGARKPTGGFVYMRANRLFNERIAVDKTFVLASERTQHDCC